MLRDLRLEDTERLNELIKDVDAACEIDALNDIQEKAKKFIVFDM